MELTRKQFVISIMPSVLIMLVSLLVLFSHVINSHNMLTGGMAISAMISFVVGGIIPISLIRRRNIDVSKAVIWLTVAAVVGFTILAVLYYTITYFFIISGLVIIIPVLELIGFIVLFKKLTNDSQKCLVLILSNPLLHFFMFIVLAWFVY